MTASSTYVLERLGEQPVDAIGFSLGARTLLALALDHPDRFRRIVLAGVGDNLFRRGGSIGGARRCRRGDADVPMVHHFRQLAASCGQSLRRW